MKNIFKILKKSMWSIIGVFILLAVQVQLDLAIPEYTSNIINIGIQQNGIEDGIPEVIREKEFNKVLVFSKYDKKIIDSYKIVTSENKEYLLKYEILNRENLYVLKDITDKEKEDLNLVISKPLLINYFLTSEDEEIVKMRESNGELSIDPGIIEYLPEETVDKIIANFDESMSKLEPSMLNQISTAIVKAEYDIVGFDVETMQTNYIFNRGIMMIALALLVMLAAIGIAYLSSKIGSSFSRDLRSEVTNKVMSFSNKEFEEFSTASLITRSTNDIQQIQMLVIMFMRIVLYAPLLGIGAFRKVISSDINWVIAVAVSTILFLLVILLVIALPKFKILQKLVDKLNLISRETLSGLPVIRAFANEKKEEERFDKANIDLTKTNTFVNRVMTIMMPTMMLIMNGVSILIIWVGSKYVDLGTMQVGTLMAFITYTMQIIMAFLLLTVISIILPRSLISVKRISEIFDKEISINEIENPKKLPKEKEASIEFKDVYFRYPDANEDVLQDINLEIRPKTTIAFIGSTGSGKSTLINLIPRFFDVTSGKILIDGVNIKDVTLKDLRSKIGFVPQKGVLFSGTISSNISFGKNNLEESDILKSAEIAQAVEFIEGFEKKFDSPISQGGTNVSGGQRQRIAIARAIANNPDILIFDDSFSALDFKTDTRLRKALKSELKDKTVLIVASRIATIIDADEIIVLDKGNIVGRGTHKELLKNNEVYKEIAYSQLSEEELKNA